MRRWGLPAVVALGVAALLLAGCGGDIGSSSAKEVLDQARTATDGVRSYRFTAELVAEADRDRGEEARRLQWSGEWVAPEWWHIKLESGEEIVWLDGRLFGKNLEAHDDAWRDEGTVPYVGSTTPREPFLDLSEPQVLEDEVIEGAPVFHVAGMLTQEKVSTAPEFPTPIHLLIGKEDYRVLRMTIEAYSVSVRATLPGEPPATPERGASATYTYDYFDYNEPVTIEFPEGFE